MIWLRKHWGLLLGVVVFAGCVSIALLLYKKEDQQRLSVDKELKAKSEEYKRLLNADPYPNDANITTLAQNKEILKKQLIEEIGKLASGKKWSTNSVMEPINFRIELRDQVKRWNEYASNHNLELPQNFYFGMSRYSQVSPEGKDVPLLLNQISAIAELIKIMADNQVEYCREIKRVPLEKGYPAATGELLPGFNPQKDLYRPGAFYVRLPFEMKIKTSAESFRDLLNYFARSDVPFVLTKVFRSDGDAPMTGVEPPRYSIQTTNFTPTVDASLQLDLGYQRVTATIRLDYLSFLPTEPKAGEPKG